MNSDSSLLVNNHFALRQVKGKPVYTEFTSIKKSLSEQKINGRIKTLYRALGIKHIMDKNSMVLKDAALKLVLNKFFNKLRPLEHRSLPVIRKVESML